MINNLTTIFLLTIFIAACGDGFDKKNKYTYSQDKLIAVISDMYIASEALKKVDPVLKDSMNQIFKEQISDIHEVDFELVESDLDKLTKDPDFYSVLHKMVRDSLIAKEAIINAMKYD